MSDDLTIRALAAELSKKTSTSWVTYDGSTHAVWHTWLDDALLLVSGGDEQPLPDVPDGATVEVTQRSKDNGGRLLTWAGRAEVVRPDDEAWGPVTAVLVRDRLNLADLATAADHWAAHSTVRRVVPTGATTESPGDLSDDAHRAEPPESNATTRGPLPRVLHKRVRRRPRLS